MMQMLKLCRNVGAAHTIDDMMEINQKLVRALLPFSTNRLIWCLYFSLDLCEVLPFFIIMKHFSPVPSKSAKSARCIVFLGCRDKQKGDDCERYKANLIDMTCFHKQSGVKFFQPSSARKSFSTAERQSIGKRQKRWKSNLFGLKSSWKYFSFSSSSRLANIFFFFGRRRRKPKIFHDERDLKSLCLTMPQSALGWDGKFVHFCFDRRRRREISANQCPNALPALVRELRIYLDFKSAISVRVNRVSSSRIFPINTSTASRSVDRFETFLLVDDEMIFHAIFVSLKNLFLLALGIIRSGMSSTKNICRDMAC